MFVVCDTITQKEIYRANIEQWNINECQQVDQLAIRVRIVVNGSATQLQKWTIMMLFDNRVVLFKLTANDH